MAFFSHALSPSEAALVAEKAAPRPNFLVRFYLALLEARQRAAEKEIARYLQISGGITDSTEREIERRFLTNKSSY